MKRKLLYFIVADIKKNLKNFNIIESSSNLHPQKAHEVTKKMTISNENIGFVKAKLLFFCIFASRTNKQNTLAL